MLLYLTSRNVPLNIPTRGSLHRRIKMRRPCKNESAIKSQEFPRARFALRKVHLANIDRNNLRFTSLHFSRAGRIPVVNGETDKTRNKMKSSLEHIRANASVCMRSVAEISSPSRETFGSGGQEREMSEKIARPSVTQKLSQVPFRETHAQFTKSPPSFLFHGQIFLIARILKFGQATNSTHITYSGRPPRRKF